MGSSGEEDHKETEAFRVDLAPEKTLPRILLVTNSFGTGGAETHILSLAKGLSARGYFVAVASCGGVLEKELEKSGIQHIYAPLDSRLLHHVLASKRVLARAIKTYRFDILHAHARLAAFTSHLIAPRRNLRFVTTAHLDFPMTPLKRLLGVWGEKTLAVSEDIRSYLVREYGLSCEDICLTVNGIDPDVFSKEALAALPTSLPGKNAPESGQALERPAGSEDTSGKKALRAVKGLHIVHVSRIDKDRAYVAFLLSELIGELYDRFGVTLTIVGGGALYKKLKKRAEAVSALYPNAIHVVGEAKDVRPYLATADIFVGVSRAALEAMACGIPTLLSGNTGHIGIFRKALLDEAVATNFCCRTRPKATADMLLKDLCTIISLSDGERRALAAECESVALNDYSLDRMLTDHEAFYASLRPFLRRKANRTVIFGYHGFKNLGDEVILRSMIASLRQNEPDRGITVLSASPRLTEARYSVRAVARRAPLSYLAAIMRAKTMYVGGGSLLQSETSHRSLCYYAFFIRFAKLLRKEVVFFANGIEALPKKDNKMVARLLGGTVAITLRDSASYGRTLSLVRTLPAHKRPSVMLTADSGFLVKSCEKGRLDALLKELQGADSQKPYFVLSTNGCKKARKREKAIEKAIELACEKGYVPIFLSMQPTVDSKRLKRLARRLHQKRGIKATVTAPSAEEAVGILSRASFLITSRLHPMIFASTCNLPTLVYAPEGKCRIFAEELFGKNSFIDSEKETDGQVLCERLCLLFESLAGSARDPAFYPRSETVEEMKALAAKTPFLLEEALTAHREAIAARVAEKAERKLSKKKRCKKTVVQDEK